MNSWEREQARKLLKTQELLKTPEGRAIYESSKRKAEEEKRRKETLDNYAQNGFYRPPVPEENLKTRTENEMRMDNILKNFS